MEESNWAPEHSQALREYRVRGMSYAEIADALNARFGTSYTRNATIGRGKRMGLGGGERQQLDGKPERHADERAAKRISRRREAEPAAPSETPQRAEPARQRCVGVRPRLLELVDLEPGDCRYPYGGDREGETIAFCGHPQRKGSSYCSAHFHLTRGAGTASERAAGPVVLRLVAAAA
jgi:GcrA cell cycle regulator